MHSLIALAKLAVEHFIKKKEMIGIFPDLPKEFLTRRTGTFVTIMKNGQLRGCIGTYLPTKENIAEEIIHNAIAAATEDYRFELLQKEELPHLSYTVCILSKPELVKNIKMLNPKKLGIIVKTTPLPYSTTEDVVFNGHFVPKTGLLLPDLEGVDTIEKQIAIACQKGGINPLKERLLIYRFSVEKYAQ